MSVSYTTHDLRQEAHRLLSRRDTKLTWMEIALHALGNAEEAEHERDKLRTAPAALRSMEEG